jgi:hypothetical protein
MKISCPSIAEAIIICIMFLDLIDASLMKMAEAAILKTMHI